MPEMFPFAREDVFPSWFADRIQDFLSAAETNLRLSRKNATTVQVIPDAALGIAAVDLQGRWRFNEATTEREHPGGAKATYTVWAVAEDNDVDDTPKPHTDHTNYAFTLRITSGANPSGSGVVVFEKIGEIDWSGTEIEAVRQTLNSVTGPMIADGALAGTGDIEWKREPSGAWVPQLKTDSVTAAEIAAGAVGAIEVNNELKPSGGAAAGTEALRAIGSTASTVVAGNDSRLTDERTPKNSSVTMAKLAAALAEILQPRGYDSLGLEGEQVNPSSERSLTQITGGAVSVKTIKATFGGHVVSFIGVGTVTWKTTGNIVLKGATQYAMAAGNIITFVYDSSAAVWRELARTPNEPLNLTILTAMLAESAVTTAKIADGAATPAKVASQESTNNASEEQNAPGSPMVRLVSGTAATVKNIKAGKTGQVVTYIRINAGAVVFKDGTGNLRLNGDMTFTTEFSTLTLVWDNIASVWVEMARSVN